MSLKVRSFYGIICEVARMTTCNAMQLQRDVGKSFDGTFWIVPCLVFRLQASRRRITFWATAMSGEVKIDYNLSESGRVANVISSTTLTYHRRHLVWWIGTFCIFGNVLVLFGRRILGTEHHSVNIFIRNLAGMGYWANFWISIWSLSFFEKKKKDWKLLQL